MNWTNWISWQLDYLYLLQNLREVTHHIFDSFFLHITWFGEVYIPVLFFCAIYWSVNKKGGLFIMFNYLFGFIANTFLKTTACIYRPWLLDERIKPLAEAIPAATGYSFPSGHTAGAVSVWGGTAIAFWNNKILRYACFTIILLVMFSRNYVGVHTPQDVLVSFVVGVILLLSSKKLFKWLEEKQNNDLIFVGILTLVCIILQLYVTFKNYPIECFGVKALYNPTPIKFDTFAKIGCVLGVVYGWLIENRYVKFNPENGTFFNKIIRTILGSCILCLILCFIKPLLIGLIGKAFGQFVCYFITGLFVTLIYPYLINKFSEQN